MRRVLLMMVTAVLACHSPTEPERGDSRPRGRLSGLVTIVAPCPVQTCVTPPSEFRERNVLVFDAERTRLLFTVDIDSRGAFLIDLAAGEYLIDLRGRAGDRSGDVPSRVTIRANLVTRLDIRIEPAP